MQSSNALLLSPPSLALMDSYIDALVEGFELRAPPPVVATEEEIAAARQNPEAYLAELILPKSPFHTRSDGTKVPRVPETLLWLSEGTIFIGRMTIRHPPLTPEIEAVSGHIGYAIRPRFQRQGYGTLILAKALDILYRQHGMSDAIVSCDTNNLASIGVITANGGKLINMIEHPRHSQSLINRYSVPTHPSALTKETNHVRRSS